MRAGSLRDRVFIETPTVTKDASGGLVTTLGLFSERWGAIEDAGGSEGFQNQTDQATSGFQVRLRAHRGIRARMRVLIPRGYTTLSTGVNSTATAWTIASASEFPRASRFLALVEAEFIQVTAGFATTSWTVTRAQNGTTGAAHVADVGIREYVLCDIESVQDVANRNREMLLRCREVTA